MPANNQMAAAVSHRQPHPGQQLAFTHQRPPDPAPASAWPSAARCRRPSARCRPARPRRTWGSPGCGRRPWSAPAPRANASCRPSARGRAGPGTGAQVAVERVHAGSPLTVGVDRNHLLARRVQRLVQALQVRRLGLAMRAGGGEELDQERLAGVVAERHGVTLRRLQRERWRRGAGLEQGAVGGYRRVGRALVLDLPHARNQLRMEPDLRGSHAQRLGAFRSAAMDLASPGAEGAWLSRFSTATIATMASTSAAVASHMLRCSCRFSCGSRRARAR